ncbi:hypothetical protein AGMMS50276_02760 [Synergistales bacterium]|nr:hypothetical protein AGMMS50276_02760 [Synergistales bacterium]
MTAKNAPKYLPVAAMFLILIFLFIYMCLPLEQERVKARGGVLDLRTASMTDVIYPLVGEWSFCSGELLEPKDFQNANISGDIITVPSYWRDAGYPMTGVATYRLTVMLPEPKTPLMLYMPELSVAYNLWNNGKLVKQSGVVSDRAERARLSLENALIPIEAEGSAVTLVMQMSSFEFLYGGLSGAPLLGRADGVMRYFIRTRGLYCAALGCVLMTALYHLSLFVFRRDRAYILFAVLCAICFLRFMYEKNGLLEYFQFITTDMGFYRQYFALLMLHCSAIGVFTLYVFNRGFLSRHWRVVAFYTVFCVLFEVLTPRDNIFARPSLVLLALPFTAFPLVAALRSPALREEKWTRLYLGALVLYFFVGIGNKLVMDSDLFMLGLLNNLFMIMAQSFVLSKDYANALELVENTNANLELIVSARTKDLQTATENLLTANAAMKDLITNISHDLKTPLTVMSVNLEKLSGIAREVGSAELSRAADDAWRKNLDMQRITQNLFEVSRIETGRSLYSPEWISLSEVMLRLRDKYEDFLEAAGLSLEIRYGEDAFLWCDNRKIWSVFDNVIYNAARHTASGGVFVSAETTGENAVVTIRDSGVGIASEHLPHIFERFYKASGARGVSDGESGLGLYIVKSIMESLEGGVSALSESGKGTSIILTFRKRR